MKTAGYILAACAAAMMLTACGARNGEQKTSGKGSVAQPDTTTFIGHSEGDIDDSGKPVTVAKITITPEGEGMQRVITFGYVEQGLAWMKIEGAGDTQLFEVRHDGMDAVTWSDPWGRTTTYTDATHTSVSTMEGGNTITNSYAFNEGRIGGIDSDNIDYPFFCEYEWDAAGDIKTVQTNAPDGMGSLVTYTKYTSEVNCISYVDLISVITTNEIGLQDLRWGFTSTHFPLEVFDAGQEDGETCAVAHNTYEYTFNAQGLPVKVRYGYGAEEWTEYGIATIEYNE